MTELLPVVPTLSGAHRVAVGDVNRWRGHCIENYARLEWAAHLTLAGLPQPAGSKMPTVFGERLKRVTLLVSEAGLRPHPKLHALLTNAAPLLTMRNLLVHSVGSVFVDHQGRWLWYYRFQPSKAGSSLESGSILQKEAEVLEDDLNKQVQRLVAMLTAYRNQVSA